ncbi:MAG: ParB/RepB/Spo0J family partition protein [bacterium]|nr:ParB/RepB/Spo0J family partition protein [bacterium]
MTDAQKRPFPNDPEKNAELKKLVSSVRDEFRSLQPSRKGANQPRRRALGRGLSALMSSTAVSLDDADYGFEGETGVAAGNSASDFSFLAPVADAAAERRGSFSAGDVETTSHNIETQVDIVTVSSDEASQVGEGLMLLDIKMLKPNEKQPRRQFNSEEITSLAHSIKESGVLQPILVRRLDGGNYEIVAGERRWRASQEAGLERVPVIVRELDDRETLAVSIVENVQRQNLNAIEEALAYQRLIEEFGESQSEVAKAVGKDRVSIANALRLLKLSVEVQEMLFAGILSAGHGRAILMLELHSEQLELAQRIIDEGLSVRSAEACVLEGRLVAHNLQPQIKERKNRSKHNGASKDSSFNEVENRLRRALGTKVGLRIGKAGAGEVRIAFYSHEELNSLLERLGA